MIKIVLLDYYRFEVLWRRPSVLLRLLGKVLVSLVRCYVLVLLPPPGKAMAYLVVLCQLDPARAYLELLHLPDSSAVCSVLLLVLWPGGPALQKQPTLIHSLLPWTFGPASSRVASIAGEAVPTNRRSQLLVPTLWCRPRPNLAQCCSVSTTSS